MVLLFLHELKTLPLLDVPGDIEHAVGPEREGLVAATPGETYALFDEAGAQAEAAPFRFDQEESELGDLITGLHAKTQSTLSPPTSAIQHRSFAES